MPDSSQPQMSAITSSPSGRSWRSRRHELEDAGHAGGVVVGARHRGARTDSSASAAASASAARLATAAARRRVSAAATRASSGTSASEARPWVRAARASPARQQPGVPDQPGVGGVVVGDEHERAARRPSAGSRATTFVPAPAGSSRRSHCERPL